MAVNLETERLTMRSWAETDADDYCALVAERDDGMLTVEAARERIANLLATSAETGMALLPICRRVEGDFIGYCGLIIGRATVEEPEIAYELFRRVHGHGYATEAARRGDRDWAEAIVVNGGGMEHAIVTCAGEAGLRTRPCRTGRRQGGSGLADTYSPMKFRRTDSD